MASITRWLAIVCLALVACAGQPDAQECTTGITCPEGTKCAAVQPICITNDCGDGVAQTSEACDDGNIVDGDGCSADCRSREECGDGVLNAAAGELCDDGDTDGGDGCASDCRSIEICGNGVRDVNEACDDGNTVPGDGCSGNCKSTEVCGNSIVDLNEKCDDGSAPGGCNDDCQGGTGCGDGAIDKDGSGNPLEECDDGNTNNQDDCTTACQLNTCGDGIVQTSGVRVEECDPFVNFGETAACNIDCTNAGCGDGKLNNEAEEQCDDANIVDTDLCRNTCKINVCGDGVEGGPDEACDAGMDTTMCDADCTLKSCGDGYVNTLEECDSGGVDATWCDANCTIPMCGDGTTNSMAGEDCDDMDADNGDNCRNDCKFPACGDGFVDVEPSMTETCDDGDKVTETECDYGVQSCQLCNDTCTMALNLTGNVCGDNSVHSPQEACDDGNRVTETSCPYGTASCMNLCSDDCKTPLDLTGPFCGDGTTQASSGESCDDKNADACGRCDEFCNMFASAAATGYIIAASGQEITDDDTLTINDGFGTTVVFEFDKDASGPSDTNMTNEIITISNTDTAGQIAAKLRVEIDNSALRIDATDPGGSLVTLLHDRKSSLGNQLIDDSIGDSDFIVSGMAGGAGGNCGAMVACTHNDDCQSGTCTSGMCTMP